MSGLEKTPARGRYSESWKSLSHRLKEEADWKCSRCGCQCLRPGEYSLDRLDRSKIGKRTLNVHHEDRDRANDDELNLVVLCQPCHLAAHRPERVGKGICSGQLSFVRLVRGVWVGWQ
ncbi:HNH endonuclease [Leptolyngbya sp. FACHB-541]|uniref:HNH endonuclease signature motif containing protein n=1 Tax=Leptolyngbya sp. FACHB-541 TaxID=2692810 RepID=UPI0016860CCB|nr:HNH endonuclease signature motif containing protein [Leptolyngbya sp. FACHB-541]MBD1995992.1 HNH endonuclease [Leptolyngbya sp. FACHB-541]